MMKNYTSQHRDDPEVFVDYSTYYRENELQAVSPAYGGILNGPTWARFVVWWHRTNRTYTTSNEDRAEALKYELACFLDEDGWNYINGISHGCTKLVDPDDIVEHKEVNYLILQACNYYEKVDAEKWQSPLLVALRANQEVPTTKGRMIPPSEEGQVTNYQAIDTMVSFGGSKLTNMEEAWVAAVAESTKPGNLDLRGTMEALRSDLKFKRSRL